MQVTVKNEGDKNTIIVAHEGFNLCAIGERNAPIGTKCPFLVETLFYANERIMALEEEVRQLSVHKS